MARGGDNNKPAEGNQQTQGKDGSRAADGDVADAAAIHVLPPVAAPNTGEKRP